MADRPEDVGTGVLFRNDRREKPSRPEFKGEATIEGKKYWVAAWVKEKNDKKFFSLAFRSKDEQPAKPVEFRQADRRCDPVLGSVCPCKTLTLLVPSNGSSMPSMKS